METAVYFPYVRVPESAWFTQILLYWDRAASIVPTSLEQDDSVLSQYMRELRRAELLDFIDPDRELGIREDTFISAFLALVDSRDLRKSKRPLSYTLIHTGKMAETLFRTLERQGLARRAEGPAGDLWWSVESATADVYMSYLASALCGRRDAADSEAVPVTDSKSALAAFSTQADDLEGRLRALRYTTIMEALPAPATALPAREIADFKKGARREQLKRLRRHLDDKLVDIAALTDPELREVKAKLAVEDIRDEVAILREQMERRWARIVLVGVGGLVGAALGVVSGVVTAGTSTLALGLAVGSGFMSTSSAGYRALEMLRSPAFDKNSPMAYAALAPR